MKEVTLEELLEAGCHFGHQVTRHNPKSRDFVFEARDNIHIIDLGKTKEGLLQAAEYMRSLAQNKDSNLIVVGTKRQAHGIIQEEVKRARSESGEEGLYYVTDRWIGGICTNFQEVSKNFKKLKDFTARLADDEEKAKYTKKEIGQWDKKRKLLENLYGGIVELKRVPDALFIIDTHLEHLAVREALKTNVTTVGIVDTNADPHIIDYPIPANDDAVGSIQFIVRFIMDAWIEGRKKSQETEKTIVEKGEEVGKEEKKKETKGTDETEGVKEKKKRGRKPKVKDAEINSA